MKKILLVSFFDRPTLGIARDLLGSVIVRKWRGKEIVLVVTETEAYDGPRDRASHASRGMTARNQVMFGPPGRFYVYFTYGMHWLVNIVTGPERYPAAVLIRAGTYYDKKKKVWIPVAGPARLTKFLHITGAQNGKIVGKRTGLWFEDRGLRVAIKEIEKGPRIGVDYAGPLWSKRPYRFTLKEFSRVE
jgi:DNA-3-methyladenine glycosylase